MRKKKSCCSSLSVLELSFTKQIQAFKEEEQL